VGEVGGAGQERQGGWGFGCGGGELGESGRACGGAGGSEESTLPTLTLPTLIEVVVRNGLGVGGIEPGGPGDLLTTERVSRRLAGAQRRQPGGLVEVVEEESLGGLVVFPTVGPHVELGLRRSPGGMGERG
jgi:hypothetical protein